MIEQTLIVTGPSPATLAAALVASGLLIEREGGIFPTEPTTLYSPMSAGLSGEASCLVRFQAADQATADAVLAVIGADNINRASAPLRMVAGALQPKADAWLAEDVEFALAGLNRLADWEAAILAISTQVDATPAQRKVPVRWRRSQWLTLQEPWVNAIVTQMRTTLGWTVAQRNQFLNQLKTRATAEAGV